MQYLACYKLILVLGGLVLCGWSVLLAIKGPHEHVMREASAYFQYALWWIGLGVASSIGTGYGWPTFVMYVVPHIAMFTIKATLCGRVDLKVAQYDTALFRREPTWEYKDCAAFGEPFFPKATSSDHFRVPWLPILREVHWEAVLWGVGATLGELPPYIFSRAGKMLKESDDLRLKDASDQSAISRLPNRLKLSAIKWFQQTRFKFWIILGLASVPNPLFDLAGIICGQFQVPFWMFFVPTLIGKALVKTHYQTIAVIVLTNGSKDALAVSGFVGWLEKLLRNRFFGPEEKSWMSSVWDTLLMVMMFYLLSSFISATAQNYVSRRQRNEKGNNGVADFSADKRNC